MKSFISAYEGKILEFIEAERLLLRVDGLGKVSLPRGSFVKFGKPVFWSSDLNRLLNQKLIPKVVASTSDLQRFLNYCDEASADNVRGLLKP